MSPKSNTLEQQLLMIHDGIHMLDMFVQGLTEPLVSLGETYIPTRRKRGRVQRTGASSHRVWWFCFWDLKGIVLQKELESAPDL